MSGRTSENSARTRRGWWLDCSRTISRPNPNTSADLISAVSMHFRFWRGWRKRTSREHNPVVTVRRTVIRDVSSTYICKISFTSPSVSFLSSEEFPKSHRTGFVGGLFGIRIERRIRQYVCCFVVHRNENLTRLDGMGNKRLGPDSATL